ncbi:transposase [Deinococcus altitudinis]|uniref:transposase n=1 Tax=Deinococcus altitudinis TaxID=468914 RepID=UPI0038921807
MLRIIERGGQLALHLCDNVQQRTIQPHILKTIQAGSVVNTDEYAIYGQLPAWGYTRHRKPR